MIGAIIIFGVMFLVALAVGVFAFNKKSYKHECFVLHKTGENWDDAIIERDTFKVKKMKGHYQIWFYKHNGKSYNPPLNFWTKFWTHKQKAVPETETEYVLNTDTATLKKHITRGAIFAKVGEREYKPVKITQTGDLTVVDQDTVELFLDDLEREKELTTTFRDKLIQLGLWLGSLFIIATLCIVLIVLTTKFANEQSAQILGAVRAGATAVAGVGA